MCLFFYRGTVRVIWRSVRSRTNAKYQYQVEARTNHQDNKPIQGVRKNLKAAKKIRPTRQIRSTMRRSINISRTLRVTRSICGTSTCEATPILAMKRICPAQWIRIAATHIQQKRIEVPMPINDVHVVNRSCIVRCAIFVNKIDFWPEVNMRIALLTIGIHLYANRATINRFVHAVVEKSAFDAIDRQNLTTICASRKQTQSLNRAHTDANYLQKQ